MGLQVAVVNPKTVKLAHHRSSSDGHLIVALRVDDLTTIQGDAGLQFVTFLRALKDAAADALRIVEGHLCAECRNAPPTGLPPWASLCTACGNAKSAEWKAVAESVQDEPKCKCQGCGCD